MLIFYPLGGLANRMRVIDSAVRLSEKLNATCRIYWLRDAGLNCKFSTIWQSTKHVKDSESGLLPLFFKLRRRWRLFRVVLAGLEKLRLLKVFDEFEYEALREIAYQGNLQRYSSCIAASYSAKSFFEVL